MSGAARRSGSGRLIVFEGPEGVGKSTQVRLLAEWFEAAGRPALLHREPGSTPLGNEIRRLLLEPGRSIAAATEALLFMASRAELVDVDLGPALRNGRTVLLDRYFLSTYAYQIHGRGLDETAVVQANRLATRDLTPDITLLLELPAGEGLARAAKRSARDRMEAADDAFHERVATAFRLFTRPEWMAAHPECGPIVRIDASGSPAAVTSRIVDALTARFDDLGALALEASRERAVSSAQPVSDR
jgi:dTMP kinase